jgi:hypothetical protein
MASGMSRKRREKVEDDFNVAAEKSAWAQEYQWRGLLQEHPKEIFLQLIAAATDALSYEERNATNDEFRNKLTQLEVNVEAALQRYEDENDKIQHMHVHNSVERAEWFDSMYVSRQRRRRKPFVCLKCFRILRSGQLGCTLLMSRTCFDSWSS